MMSSGAISVRIGMLPEMKTTEPYSPSARANASVKPVTSAGQRAREDHAPERLQRGRAEAGRGLLDLRIEVLDAPAAPCARRTAAR